MILSIAIFWWQFRIFDKNWNFRGLQKNCHFEVKCLFDGFQRGQIAFFVAFWGIFQLCFWFLRFSETRMPFCGGFVSFSSFHETRKKTNVFISKRLACTGIFFGYNSWRLCRSTSARLVNSHSLSRTTYQARRQQTKNSRLKT